MRHAQIRGMRKEACWHAVCLLGKCRNIVRDMCRYLPHGRESLRPPSHRVSFVCVFLVSPRFPAFEMMLRTHQSKWEHKSSLE